MSDTPQLLSDYLLIESPACILLIGSEHVCLEWSEASSKHPQLIYLKSLEEVESGLHSLLTEHDMSVSPQVAVLGLNDDGQSVEQQLGHAVRLFPDRLLVYTNSAEIPDTTLFSFGFRKLDIVDSEFNGVAQRWFEYRLSQYKQPPDWLNARFWANPARFDQDDDLDSSHDYTDIDELDDEEE